MPLGGITPDPSGAAPSPRLPVFVGSGTTPERLAALAPHTDAFIVGSDLKHAGRWFNPPDPARVKRMVDAMANCKR